MTKIYFSATDFFVALNSKLKAGTKLSMRAIEQETHISRYQLAKLRDGKAVRISQEMVEQTVAKASGNQLTMTLKDFIAHLLEAISKSG